MASLGQSGDGGTDRGEGMQQGAESSIRSPLFLGVARPGVRLGERGNGPAVKLARAGGILFLTGMLLVYGLMEIQDKGHGAATPHRNRRLQLWMIGRLGANMGTCTN
jgi:hypothetical protein